MTTKSLKALKGWSIGFAAAVIAGTFMVLTSSTEKAGTDTFHVIMTSESDTMEFRTADPIEDIEIITNIPQEEVEQAILMGTRVEGYEIKIK